MTDYLDATRSITERAEALLRQMTLDEKVAQLGSFWIYEVLDGLEFSEAKARGRMLHGIGHVTRLGGASNVRPRQAARLSNTLQRYLLEQTRLKIPAVIHEECCGGYMAFGATVFPQAIGVASAWEPELVEAMTAVIRQQMRSVGAHHALAPVLDVARDPRWGRTEETFGEDPYLIARTGIAYVKGLQGSDLRAGIAATAKHFVGYGASEGGMNWAPPHIPAREMREVYLLPFEAAVKEGRLASMMNGYHDLDGVPCGAARWLLTETLREQWGFTGTLVSDYFAVNMLHTYHALAHDKAHAAGMALEAGIDVELPSTDCYGEPLREAVLRGDIRESLVDVAVRRLLEQKFALGVFESPYVDEGTVVFDTPDQRKLARDLAAKSLVLLKNDDVLPLSKDLKSIAVIGPNADVVRNLFGDYCYPAHIETLLGRETEVTFDTPQPDKASVSNIGNFIEVVSVLHAIREKVGPQVAVNYAQGCDVLDPSTEGFAEAVDAASRSEAVILVVGDKAGLTDSCTSGEARDRAVLDLPGVQPELVRAVLAAGKPTVLVLVIGRPATLHELGEQAGAVLVAWFPGEEGAGAIADALFGDVNPGGKLPITFPHSVGQIPVYYGHKPSGGRSHWKGVYVETPCEPRYPFGHGLSYTQFAIRNLRVPGEVQTGSGFQAQVEVKNTGARPGDEVVQLYTRTYGSTVTRPVKELRGFKRVTLQPGETRTITFEVDGGQLGYYDQAMEYVVEPGKLEIMVGASSEDIREKAEVRLTGAAARVEKTFGGRVSVS